jgi:hypothetical protein
VPDLPPPRKGQERKGTMATQIPDVDITTSNSLADLAARIRAEHEATATALKDSVRHAIAAGEMLIEAKALLKHGQWLPWLREHCTISERTAQLYMRTAKNRKVIEDQIRNGAADLSLNETAALLMMSSDVRQLLAFARDCEQLSGDELVARCIAEGIAVIKDPDYHPLAGRSEIERLEWHLFMLFLSCDTAAGRAGYMPKDASSHIEWVLQRPFQNVAEWLGEEGEKFRRQWGMRSPSEQFLNDWAAFLANNRNREFADVAQELEALQRRCEQEAATGIIAPHQKRRTKRRPARSHADAEAVS